MHSRALIKEIRESGLRLGSDETVKRARSTVAMEADELRTSKSNEEDTEIVVDDSRPQLTDKHFILSDAQKHEEVIMNIVNNSQHP